MKSLFLSSVVFVLTAQSVFAEDVPPANAGRIIVRPTFYPGDRWEQGCKIREAIKAAESRVVISVTGCIVRQDLVYTEEMNLTNGYGPKTGAPITYSPHTRYFSYPLYAGKKWGGEVQWTSPAGGSDNFRMEAEAVGWEKIGWNGLEYDMLRIEYKNSGAGVSTCWYLPEAKANMSCTGSLQFTTTSFSVR